MRGNKTGNGRKRGEESIGEERRGNKSRGD